MSLADDNREAEANTRFIVRACNAHDDLRRASQELYDRLQDQLDVPDSELPEGLVAALDALEETWRIADGPRRAVTNRTQAAGKVCLNCGRPKPLGGKVLESGRCNLCLVVEEALEAYGEVLARHFPEARPGDQSPLTAFALEKAVTDAAAEWISNNVTDGSDAVAA